MKEQLKVLTCGSVDDGKSTLIGHMIYDSKSLYADQKRILELESKMRNGDGIDYSLLLDGLDEEREQGITIDVSYRYFNTKKRNFIILDTPGHEEYIRNMAVGASQADVAILLIDATKGILTQTKRHIKICMMMGISDYIIAINKMDLIAYNEKVYNDIQIEIMKFFESFTYNSIKIIPVSATKGDNINANSTNMKWYTDYSLLNYLETVKINRLKTNKFILPIQRVCRPNQNFRGFQGNVASGKIEKSEGVICLPSGEKTTVERLFYLDKEVENVKQGQPVTVCLEKEIDISRGCVLTNDENVAVSDSINVTMLWMDDHKLKLNNSYYLMIGNKMTLCYVRKIHYKLDIDTDEKLISNFANKNEIVNCTIEISERIAITTFDHNKVLGSLILINRITNSTCACAIVNDVTSKQNLFNYETTVNPEIRSHNLAQIPITIWFTGLSSSGKSTIADELEKILVKNGYHTMLLDGDNVRLGINNDLKFTEKDRIENIRRLAHVAKLMNEAGLICLTSSISPLEINREMARSIIGKNFFLVYVSTPIEECEKRDKKGLYKKAKAGLIKDFTGVNSPFDPPSKFDIEVNNYDAKDCAETIYENIVKKIEQCK